MTTTTAVRVVVRDLAVEHVGDGLEAAVRVPRRALRLVRPVLHRPELVEQEERVGLVEAQAARERPPHLEPGAFDGVVRGDDAARRAAASSLAGSGRAMRGRPSGLSTVTAGMAVLESVRGWAVRDEQPCACNYSPPWGASPRPTSSLGRSGPRVTGSASRPRSTRRPFHAGSSTASSIFGKRRTSVPMAMRPSSRASAAPRQWWMPAEREVLRRRPAGSGRAPARRAPVRGVAVGGGEAHEHEGPLGDRVSRRPRRRPW